MSGWDQRHDIEELHEDQRGVGVPNPHVPDDRHAGGSAALAGSAVPGLTRRILRWDYAQPNGQYEWTIELREGETVLSVWHQFGEGNPPRVWIDTHDQVQ